MSKHTTTIYEFLTGELKRLGFDEFINDGKLTYNDDNFAFMQKVLYFDEDIQKIVDDKIFKGFKLDDEKSDIHFKESFILRFMDREIGRQTIEAFASQVLYVTITRREYINTVFSHEVQKYLDNHVINQSEDIGTQEETSTENKTNEENEKENRTNEETEKSDSENSNREATSTLPQSEINLNVNDDELTYADENRISKDKNNGNRNTIGTGDSDRELKGKGTNDRNANQNTNDKHNEITKTFTLENLDKIYSMKEKLFEEYDRKCFLHIW